MKIAVFGCGYVGLTTATGLAELGHTVIGIDLDAKKIASIKKGVIPFYEPDLADLLKKNLKRNNISFSTDAKTAIKHSDIVVSAVGTPPKKDTSADLSAVLQVAAQFGKHAGQGKIFINKSTVPVGTSQQIRSKIMNNQINKFSFDVISNPEFLREGSALKDFFKPDRIIVGLEKPDSRLIKLLKNIYKPVLKSGVKILFTDIKSAECIKYASNAYLSTRVSFINEIANFCELVGADANTVALGVGLDKRIGTAFFKAGIGFGGSCLPKDLDALISLGSEKKFDFRLLKAVQNINKSQPLRVITKLKTLIKPLKGKRISVWGMAFKPETDDIREAPSITVITKLLQGGAQVQTYDPAATNKARVIFGNKIKYYSDPYSALAHADALLILTEWNEFKAPDYTKMAVKMSNYYIVDGRNVLNPKTAKKHGFKYLAIGR